MVLVLVFLGNLAGTGSNETLGGGGGRDGGVHKGIRDAVDADLFGIKGEGACSTGDCDQDLSADVDSDATESDISR